MADTINLATAVCTENNNQVETYQFKFEYVFIRIFWKCKFQKYQLMKIINPTDDKELHLQSHNEMNQM